MMGSREYSRGCFVIGRGKGDGKGKCKHSETNEWTTGGVSKGAIRRKDVKEKVTGSVERKMSYLSSVI